MSAATLRRAGLLLLVAVLSGCQSPVAGPGAVHNVQLVTQPATQPAARQAPTQPVQPPINITRADPTPARTYPDPKNLQGVSGETLAVTIGMPQFTRHDQPAEIWQYRGADCTLDFFLYQSVAGEPYTVGFIETRPQPGGPTTNKACLVSILKERETRQAPVPTS